MASFWVTWRGRGPATVNADTKDAAREIAKEHGEVVDVRQLPYPRRPEINPGSCPAFCYGRNECLDQTACPNRYSCSE